eukprot:TRINITY_DN16513_c0_g1_i1.p1 TRINITY_DN16513_c0_g1~~TRINITY_DN16513_c0_g1_i1.p1  ORF type:complete len:608 (-),score=158.18 TRINITY_DN16513_c0_g1_i1:156-1928(-)
MDDAEDCGHLYGFGKPDAPRTKLQEIVERRHKDVAEAKARRPAEALLAEAEEFRKTYGAARSLVDCLEAEESAPWGLALAAEFKRASPSKGDINASLDAAQQALEYTKVGASVLSVLTEPTWFKGSLTDLRDVRVKTQAWAKEHDVRRPVCLRKDFLVDEYQVLEAVAHGADTALLMVSILSRSRLRALIECCRSHGIEPLVEVVTSAELRVALDAGARVLGVNNRNLHTFELDRERTAQLAKELRETFNVTCGVGGAVKLMALSGLATADDVEQCRKISCSGVLIGEALMRASDPGAAILELMGGPADGAGSGAGNDAVLPVAPGATLVKVCGVVRPEDARVAVGAGANLIGVIFATSKRQVSETQASAVVDVVRRFGERTAPVVRASAPKGGATLADRSLALRRACRRSPLVVGVFMDQSLDEIVAKVAATGVDAVQLHGHEDMEFIRELRQRLPHAWFIKVVHLPPRGEAGAAESEAALQERLSLFGGDENGACDALLLDTAVKGSASGGTGAAFDWEVAKRAQECWGVPVIVAGGLTDANVGELVTQVLPFGVDVASGVEDSPGVKNATKSAAYVRNAKRARVGAA